MTIEEKTENTENTEAETYIKWRMLNLSDNVIQSNNDDSAWKIGERRSVDTEYNAIRACAYGFHCSDNIYDARSNIGGRVVARVEVSGKHDEKSDKSAWQHMKIMEAWTIPSYDGLSARLNAMLTSEKWASVLVSEFSEWVHTYSEDSELEDSNDYYFHHALQALRTVIPVERVEEAYEEYVRTFIPLENATQETDFVILNEQFNAVTVLKQDSYTTDELDVLYTTASKLVNTVYSLNHSFNLPHVTSGKNPFSA